SDSVVNVPGALTISATNDAMLNADTIAASVSVSGAGGFAASLTFSLSQAENQFGGTTRAMIDDSDVTSGSTLKLDSKSTADLTSNATAVSVSASFAGAAAFSISVAASEAKHPLPSNVPSPLK